MIRRLTRAAVASPLASASMAAILGVAIACACGTTAASPPTEVPACTSLAACCGSAGAGQAVCASIVASNVAATCSTELASLEAMGACGSTGTGTGTSTGSASGCSALAACCKAMTGSSAAQCDTIVGQGVATTCTAELTVYEAAGSCGKTTSSSGTLTSSSMSSSTSGLDAGMPSGFGPGDGGPCTGPVGGFPSPSCDPSDEMACSASIPSGCTLSPKCGNPSTCEPFVTNPTTGVESFRMRLLNITAPSSLSNQVVQGSVVTAAVDLPADAGSCGENGSGTFNWLIQVDTTTHTVKTGGAPPSSDPFGLGYCFTNATVAGTAVAPTVLGATFTGTTFSTASGTTTLNMPIFVTGGGAVVLPLAGASFNDVTVSDSGNCIGAVNNGSIVPSSSGVCTDSNPTGQDSCSRWHTAGTIGAHMSLAAADQIPVVTLGNESLCVLLTGQNNGSGKCPTAALTAGDYCSTTKAPGGCGDSMWFSAEFAASAVNITAGAGITLCGG